MCTELCVVRSVPFRPVPSCSSDVRSMCAQKTRLRWRFENSSAEVEVGQTPAKLCRTTLKKRTQRIRGSERTQPLAAVSFLGTERSIGRRANLPPRHGGGLPSTSRLGRTKPFRPNTEFGNKRCRVFYFESRPLRGRLGTSIGRAARRVHCSRKCALVRSCSSTSSQFFFLGLLWSAPTIGAAAAPQPLDLLDAAKEDVPTGCSGSSDICHYRLLRDQSTLSTWRRRDENGFSSARSDSSPPPSLPPPPEAFPSRSIPCQ